MRFVLALQLQLVNAMNALAMIKTRESNAQCITSPMYLTFYVVAVFLRQARDSNTNRGREK